MTVQPNDEQAILDLARQTTERLQSLTIRLEAYLGSKNPDAYDNGRRRRSDDKGKP